MNTKGSGSKTACALALVSLYFTVVGSAHAVPVTYSFTSARSFEANLPSSPGAPPGPPSTTLPDQVFVPGEVFFGTFTYDNEAALFISAPTIIIFSNALTDLSGNVDGHLVSMASASASIIVPPTPLARRLSFSGSAPGTTIGDWISSNLSLVFGTYAETTLPSILPPVGTPPLISQISINFTNSVSGQLRQVAFGSVVITPIPEPASWSLIMLGALTLLRRRKSI